MATSTRVRAAAIVLAFGVLSACGGSGEMTVSEIADSIDCTDLRAMDNPNGNKAVVKVGTCTKDGEGVIITTYTSNAERDVMVADNAADDVATLLDKGEKWTAFAFPSIDPEVVEELGAIESPGEAELESASTCDVAREAFLTGTDDEIEAALQELQADKSAPTVAREYADYYLHRDAGNPDRLEADKSLIRSACG